MRVVAPNRTFVPVLRLDLREGQSGIDLLTGSGQRTVSVQSHGPGVFVEIATRFEDRKDSLLLTPTEWLATILKPGEALRLASDLQKETQRAIDWVVSHSDAALSEWDELIKVIKP